MSRKLTTESFIDKASKIHNNKYDYTLVTYKKSKIKVEIICPNHGPFLKTPNAHLSGSGCPKCIYAKRSLDNYLTNEEYIIKANKKHNYYYSYGETIYKGSQNKIIITCHIHGNFIQQATNHLHGQGCSKCGIIKRNNSLRSSLKNFISKANKIHNKKYDYSKSIYINNSTNLIIICSEHGSFEQTPRNHLRGTKCPKCALFERVDKRTLSQDEFILRSNNVHNNKYDYSKVKYVNAKTKVTIICPEHGDYDQEAFSHLSGCGCPICNTSKGELSVLNWLQDNKIQYEYQKIFNGLIGLGGGNLIFDFYLEKLNLCIEYDGIQHYTFIEGLHITKNNFKKQQIHDKCKNEYCKENNIKLLRIRYDEDVNVVLSKYFYL